ncbi:hypothetical protein BDW02DRAFT_410808 [Decorospora gaudefroyi]|uniref:Uncharacterized protein n=1 Tax=Decorospora gaudefroyi TaxID=184978 RepID=A0A6A5K673_9PLEO|nr:hypothetical protein BDW02DRAFT_410808 [Decorospora gaudefroyi]
MSGAMQLFIEHIPHNSRQELFISKATVYNVMAMSRVWRAQDPGVMLWEASLETSEFATPPEQEQEQSLPVAKQDIQDFLASNYDDDEGQLILPLIEDILEPDIKTELESDFCL